LPHQSPFVNWSKKIKVKVKFIHGPMLIDAAPIFDSLPSARHQSKLQNHGHGDSVYHSVPVYVPAFTDIVLLGNGGSWMCTTCLELLPDSESSSHQYDLESDTTLLTTKPSETGVAVGKWDG